MTASNIFLYWSFGMAHLYYKIYICVPTKPEKIASLQRLKNSISSLGEQNPILPLVVLGFIGFYSIPLEILKVLGLLNTDKKGK